MLLCSVCGSLTFGNRRSKLLGWHGTIEVHAGYQVDDVQGSEHIGSSQGQVDGNAWNLLFHHRMNQARVSNKVSHGLKRSICGESNQRRRVRRFERRFHRSGVVHRLFHLGVDFPQQGRMFPRYMRLRTRGTLPLGHPVKKFALFPKTLTEKINRGNVTLSQRLAHKLGGSQVCECDLGIIAFKPLG